eukprot:jgi/Orpsp1_1/1186503/evm.model.d7180000051055.1
MMKHTDFIMVSEYAKYLNGLVEEFNNSTNDIFILDSKILSSNVDFAESHYIQHIFKYRNFYKYCMDVSDVSKRYDLTILNKNLVEDGKHKGVQYGLPYETDFDIFYYNSNDLENDLPKIVPSKNVSENDLSEIMQNGNETETTEDKIQINKFPLSLGLFDEDIILSTFFDYIAFLYGIPQNIYRSNSREKEKIKNKDYFKIYSNNNLYISFKDYINRCSGNKYIKSNKMLIKDSTLALIDFLNENYLFFKGRASFFDYIRSKRKNDFLSITSLPNKRVAYNKKYLVINKESKIDKDVLKNFAYLLTFEETQLFLANNFGHVPTFINRCMQYKNESIKRRDVLENYYTNHTEVCHAMNETKPIMTRSMLKNTNYSATFTEIRLHLPYALRQYLLGDISVEDIKEIFDNAINTKTLTTENIDAPTLAIYMVLIVYIFFLVIVIIIVYEYRKHPYLKIISPDLCILIILGLIMNLIIPLTLTHIESPLLCKFSFCFAVISRNLVALPMLAIVFRIFYIYNNKSKVNFGRKLNNRRLFTFIFIALFFELIYCLFIILTKEFYIVTEGTIIESRTIYCYHEEAGTHVYICVTYYVVL